jgi:hypothetical protein
LTNLGSESETCVGSRVRLVRVFISFEKNFYRLPFTPPLSGSPYRSFNVTVKELEIVSNYVLQILHTLLHRFHGLETFIGGRVEIPDRLTASSTTHRMQSEGVFIAIVSTVVATSIVVAALVAIVTVAVGAFGSPLFGLLIPLFYTFLLIFYVQDVRNLLPSPGHGLPQE